MCFLTLIFDADNKRGEGRRGELWYACLRKWRKGFASRTTGRSSGLRANCVNVARRSGKTFIRMSRYRPCGFPFGRSGFATLHALAEVRRLDRGCGQFPQLQQVVADSQNSVVLDQDGRTSPVFKGRSVTRRSLRKPLTSIHDAALVGIFHARRKVLMYFTGIGNTRTRLREQLRSLHLL